MLSFSSEKSLISCGIDSEDSERFSGLDTGEKRPSPLIFSPREIEHCLSLDNPTAGFCASFCCKEAMYKALRKPFNMNTCELFLKPPKEQYHVTLPVDIYQEFNITQAKAQVEMASKGEYIVTIYLLR